MEPQTIRTMSGDELVVLARADYEVLRQGAARFGSLVEDASDAALAEAAAEALASGRDIAIPFEIAEAILDGEQRLSAIRRWRGLSTQDLAARAGVEPDLVTAIEAGGSGGSLQDWRSVARALEVPLTVLLDV